ncbi:GNAT family N-acetyltransferase [Breznakiella homolactica]|uniref:GNAT family N-acetyltransferase n=1 Tax=Breznakiella homolactica TaxID=2798577 RepID=A0A7T7XPV5_9SPIR|nr:GNAT family N-acetyltransferase [Breznakiella homolactica]QQO10198.1 GNAT family N-acetyltransferase [Breznakiella homolactica]
MGSTPEIRTERLLLRRFAAEDAEAFFRLMSSDEVNRFLPVLPFKKIQEAEKYLLENYITTYENPVGFRYAVCLKSDNVPIGYAAVSDSDNYDLGYGLSREYWHNGIITEACGAVIEEVRKSGIPYITATHDVNNPRSGAVMKKIGMSYRYSYEELWQPKNILVLFRMYQLNLDGNHGRVYRGYWNKYPVHFVEEGV